MTVKTYRRNAILPSQRRDTQRQEPRNHAAATRATGNPPTMRARAHLRACAPAHLRARGKFTSQPSQPSRARTCAPHAASYALHHASRLTALPSRAISCLLTWKEKMKSRSKPARRRLPTLRQLLSVLRACRTRVFAASSPPLPGVRGNADSRETARTVRWPDADLDGREVR